MSLGWGLFFMKSHTHIYPLVCFIPRYDNNDDFFVFFFLPPI